MRGTPHTHPSAASTQPVSVVSQPPDASAVPGMTGSARAASGSASTAWSAVMATALVIATESAAEDGVERVGNHVHRVLKVVLAERQRRQEAHDVLAGGERQKALALQGLEYRADFAVDD